jgi:xylulokinase
MAESVYLGIDIGTSSTKCLAVDERGRTVALTQHHYQLTHPRENWAEQDAEDFWTALVDTVSGCVRQCVGKGHSKDDIRAMAMSTQGDTLIVTDACGKPLAPAISWMDMRPDAECRELLAIRDQQFWYRELGITLTPYSSAAKIRWIQNTDPDLWNRIAKFCWVPDFLAWRLTGRHVSDVPCASWSPYLCPGTRSYASEVMDILGVRQDQTPLAVESGCKIGNLTPEAAKTLGLPETVLLIAGAFDQAAAGHGAGARSGERSVLSCGTAWVLYCPSDRPVLDPQCRIPVCCHVRPDEWGMVLPFSGGAAYDWLDNTFKGDPSSKPSDAEPPVFVPHLYGGVCPDWREDSKGSLVGLTMAHTWEDVRRAMMRGIAFEARRNFEVAEELAGEIKSVRMVGGAGKSDIWPQMVADILNRPIEVSDQHESACYGAAKLAAGDASDGWSAGETVRTCVPDPGRVESEKRNYRRFLRFYEALLEQYALDARADDQ